MHVFLYERLSLCLLMVKGCLVVKSQSIDGERQCCFKLIILCISLEYQCIIGMNISWRITSNNNKNFVLGYWCTKSRVQGGLVYLGVWRNLVQRTDYTFTKHYKPWLDVIWGVLEPAQLPCWPHRWKLIPTHYNRVPVSVEVKEYEIQWGLL